MDYKQRIINGCGDVSLTKDGCWIWKQSLRNGYGQFNEKGVIRYAHRISYEAFNGKIPEGKLVCHKCHNKQCVNPDHLYVGDKKTNAQDMINNGDGSNQYGKYDRKVSVTNGEETVTITNRSRFCKERGLNRGNFSAVVYGRRNHCKGWRLVK